MPGAFNPDALVAVGAMGSRCCYLTVVTVMRSLQDKGDSSLLLKGALASVLLKIGIHVSVHVHLYTHSPFSFLKVIGLTFQPFVNCFSVHSAR